MIVFRGLDALQDSINQADEQFQREINAFLVRLMTQVNAQVKLLTPTDTSWLKKNWFVGRPYKRGNIYYIEIGNNVEYAEWVEYGTSRHRGYHMLETSMGDLEDRLRQEINTFLRNLAR